MTQEDDLFDISRSWLLLDTYSTCDVANNPDIVTNIQDCTPSENLVAYTNG